MERKLNNDMKTLAEKEEQSRCFALGNEIHKKSRENEMKIKSELFFAV